MKSRVVVTALIEKDGKLLLGQKPKDVGPYPNTWHLPGGGVKLGEETLEEAMTREVKEETGLDVVSLKKIGFDADYEPDKHREMTHYVFLKYQVKVKDADAKAGDDLERLQWFDKSDLKNIPLTRPLEKYLKEGGLM